MRRARACLLIAVCACLGSACAAEAHQAAAKRPAEVRRANAQQLKPQVGKASIYARRFAGRRMANGERMDPHRHIAASKTLPLGTKARVTNLETGRSALVTIEDRGPFVAGRIVDLSPASAAAIGLTDKEGVAKVEVVPVDVPDDKIRTVARD